MKSIIDNCPRPKLAICGHGRCGKDTAAAWLRDNAGFRWSASTSWYLAIDMAKRLGCSREEAYERRHEGDVMRTLWYDTANEIREHDPGYLVRQALVDGDIVSGLRDLAEIVHLRESGLADLIIWIDRDVPVDPTMAYGPEVCDVIIENPTDNLPLFFSRLERLCRFARVPVHSAEPQAV